MDATGIGYCFSESVPASVVHAIRLQALPFSEYVWKLCLVDMELHSSDLSTCL